MADYERIERSEIFPKIAERLNQYFEPGELKWNLHQNTANWKDGKMIVSSTQHATNLFSAVYFHPDAFEARYNVRWGEPIFPGPIYRSSLSMKFNKYFVGKDKLCPESVVLFSKDRNPERGRDGPLFQVRYHLFEGGWDDAMTLFQDFCDGSEELFSMFKGLPNKSKTQLNRLLKRAKEHREDKDSVVWSE